MNYPRWFLLIALVCLQSACSTSGVGSHGSHGMLVDGIEIANHSSSDIESFRLIVPRDGVNVTANRIKKGNQSLNTVEPFPYRHNSVSVRWFQDGEKHTMEGLKLDEAPEGTEAVTIVIELHDKGRVVTHLR